jgi:ERF superfamily
VRKTLGQHEIATLQTTAIDEAAGTINLTTVLAHASGQWIASDWPVCAIADSAQPHRMGAALTYARRYALFTLVGIAGEDDLDAPNLIAATSRSSGSNKRNDALSGNKHHHTQRPQGRSTVGPIRRYSELSPQASAELRERLLGELKELDCGEEAAALWAQRSLPDKNKLTVTDAQHIEAAFQARLTSHATVADVISQTPERTEQAAIALSLSRPDKRSPLKTIDKSLLALPEPRRVRDRQHVRYVAQQPCLICGRRPSDAHHLRFTQSRALGRKVSDEFAVPLCRGHHREIHRCRDEAAWWQANGIDAAEQAHKLWLETRGARLEIGQIARACST